MTVRCMTCGRRDVSLFSVGRVWRCFSCAEEEATMLRAEVSALKRRVRLAREAVNRPADWYRLDSLLDLRRPLTKRGKR